MPHPPDGNGHKPIINTNVYKQNMFLETRGKATVSPDMKATSENCEGSQTLESRPLWINHKLKKRIFSSVNSSLHFLYIFSLKSHNEYLKILSLPIFTE